MQSKFICQFLWRDKTKLSRQTLIIMKLIPIFLLVCCLQVAASSIGQTVTLTANDAKITEILKQIQLQTGYNIIAEQSLLNKTGRKSVELKKATIEEALKVTFQGLPIDYTIQGKTIVFKAGTVVLPDVATHNIIEKEIVLFTISGKVTDEEGLPLAKVSVYNSTTRKGTTTAENGVFEIEAKEGDVLTFSYVGYKPQQIKIGGKKTLAIEMVQTTMDMEEFIATGYQKIKKADMTGSIAKVKSEDLLINGTNTIEQMLQGKLAGVEVVNNSGMIGTRQTVRVRGVSTLLGNQEPVWVVDGIIQEDPLPFKAKELNRFNAEPSNSELLKNFIGSSIAWLNPYDIEDVTVLKDAASTAIYGVKAANGVIIINTKRGEAGRAPVVSYNTSFSTQSKFSYDKLNLMNSKERVDVSREIWERGLTSTGSLDNVGYSGLLKQYLENKLSYNDFSDGIKQLEINNTDWLDILFQQPFNQSHNLSISGGGPNSTYYASFGANSQKGTAKGNGQNGYKGSINISTNITPRLFVTAKISASYAKTDGFFKIDPYRYASTTSRVIPAFNPDGTRSYYSYTSKGFGYNILNELEQSGNTNLSTGVNTGITLKYKFKKGFNVESVFGANYSNVNSEGYITERTNNITDFRGYEYGTVGPTDQAYRMSKLPYGGILATGDNGNFNYTWRNSLNYGRAFNKKHVVGGMIGTELRSVVYTATNSTIYGYMPDRGKVVMTPPPLIENSIGTPMANLIYSASMANTVLIDRKSNYVSYFGSGNYTYDNRYVFNVSVRGDASNRFGQDVRSRFKPIWALGGRWNIANERFFDKSGWLNDLSLRASYGYQGNVAENFGPDLIVKIPGGTSAISNITNEPIYRISSLPYADLRWEKTQTVNLGLDFNFFKGRLGATVDYYNKRSRDLIVMKDVPYENGVLQMPVNSGDLYNYGYDIAFVAIPIRTKDFSWNIGINTSRNFNKITSRQVQNPVWNIAKSGTYYKEGYPVSSFWVFDFAGLDSATGIPLFNIPTTVQDPNAEFDATAFMKYAGKMNPDFTGGFNTSVRYKTFSISTSLYASIGGKKLLAPIFTSDMIDSAPYEYNNLAKDLVNRWRKPGDNTTTDIPSLPNREVGFVTIPTGALTFGDQSQGSSERPHTLCNFSSARVVGASYLSINNISLNYTIPQAALKGFYTKSVNIGYSVSNLYKWVSKDFKGIDPEVASGSQPLPRVHSVNLSVSF